MTDRRNRLEKAEAGLRMCLAFQEAMNRQDLAGLETLLVEDCLLDPAEGKLLRGREAIIACWQETFRSLPGAVRQVEEVFGLGEHGMVRWRRLGPGGLERGVDLLRLRDGRIMEICAYKKVDGDPS